MQENKVIYSHNKVETMKKAFIITVYQLPNQLNVFIEQILQDKDSEIYIHVDMKFDYIIPEIKKDKRVHIYDKSIKVFWGSDENIKVALVMYNEVVNSNVDYEYVLFCSGQDLIVRKGLDEFLEQHKGEPFIGCLEDDFYERYNKSQTLYKWSSIFRRHYGNRTHPIRLLRGFYRKLLMTGKCPFFKKKLSLDVSRLKFNYFNYAWPVLPMDMVEYLVDYINKNPDYMQLFSGAFDPEEMFYGIFYMNSPFRNRIKFKKKNFKAKNSIVDNWGMWSESLLFQYKQNDNENHPPILLMEDIPAIEASSCFIARKFDERVDKDVIEYFRKKICEESTIH